MTQYEEWLIAIAIVQTAPLLLQSLKAFLHCDRCNHR